MDKLTKYRTIIKNTLQSYSQYNQSSSEMEIQTIFDEERDHYQVVILGWEQEKWLHYCLIHIDIKSDKIWIQLNMTEKDIAQDLVDLGIQKKDIVISFHPPLMRKLTSYALG